MRTALARRARARLLRHAPRRSVTSSASSFAEVRATELKAWAEREGPAWTPYPDGFRPTRSAAAFEEAFGGALAAGERMPDAPPERVAGRVTSRRTAGKLVFLDLDGGLQLMVEKGHLLDDWETARSVRAGDVVGAEGFPARSGRGQLSLVPRRLRLLAPCLVELPERLEDPDARYRHRHLDMLVNRGRLLPVLRARAAAVRAVRAFLDARGFLEVETPVLWGQSGGASATPFLTRSRAFGSGLELSLRIAPELFLKRLLVGGAERVYELGKVFRNEGVDHNHNPEFTTCEFYQAHATYEDLMGDTEEMLRAVVRAVRAERGEDAAGDGCLEVEFGGERIDFGAPFARVEVVPALEEAIGGPLPADLSSPGAAAELAAHCERLGAGLPSGGAPTAARLLDRLVGHAVEPLCRQPTFLVDHPLCMSPLAKAHGPGAGARAGRAQRFELFVAGQELVNAYTELNDPAEQRARFRAQAADRAAGDPEAMPPDEDYCAALEHGLVPCAGWGMGVDRLCMMLADEPHIRDVLPFPVMRPAAGARQ